MGVVNNTSDRFSDGGRYIDQSAALEHARRLIADGADMLDLGGESTRPNSEPVPALIELSRVIPLIQAIRAESAISISVDTMKPQVASAAMAAGATLWNDVTALRHAPSSLETAAELGCEVALMHMRGEPSSMQDQPIYDDVVSEVEAFLVTQAEAAIAAGVSRERIMLDPGVGFGKTLEHNLAILAQLDRFVRLGFRVLLGVSRKRFIRAIDPLADQPSARLGGSLAAVIAGAQAGCAVVRVHDVRETVQALKVHAAIARAK